MMKASFPTMRQLILTDSAGDQSPRQSLRKWRPNVARKVVIGFALLLGTLLDIGIAQAQQTWHLNNVRLDNGAYVRGSFTYNANDGANGSFSNIAVRVTQPNNEHAVVNRYRIVNSSLIGNSMQIRFIDAAPGTEDLTDAPYLSLRLDSGMINFYEGAVRVLPGASHPSFEGACTTAACGEFTRLRQVRPGGRIVSNSGPLTWYVDNVRFDSGATASGSFKFDPTVGRFGTMSEIRVNVTNPDGSVNNYQRINPFSGGNDRYISLVAAAPDATDLTGAPYLALTPAFQMSNAGGDIDILPGPQDLSYQGVCSRADCGPASEPYEEALSGRIRAAVGPRVWHLRNVRFANGATASGSFPYNSDSDTFRSFLPSPTDVRVRNADGSVTVFNRTASGAPGNPRLIRLVSAPPNPTTDLTGAPYMELSIPVEMTNLGGVIDITPGSELLLGTCLSADCVVLNTTFTEALAGGRLESAPRPGPTTWHLEGVRFDNGARLTGSYEFDPHYGRFGTYSNIDIQNNKPDQTVDDFQIVNPFSGGNDRYLSIVAAPGGDLTGAPFVAMTPALHMSDSPYVAINISPGPQALSYSGFCARADCGPADGPYQEIVSGRISRIVVPPTIVTGAAVSIPENQTSVIDVNSTDNLDSEGNGLVYRFSGGADQFLLNIDASTGVVTFINPPDYENPADAGRNNIYNAQVTVTDLGGRTDAQDLVITIIDTQTWRLDGAQLSNGQTVAGTFDYSAAENRYFNLDITVNDGAGTTYNVFNPGVNATGETLSLINQLVGDLTGRSTLRFTFASPLPAAGGTIDIRTSIPIAGTVSTLATCANIDCSTYTTPLESMTGRVTTLSEGTAPTANPTFAPPANAAGWHNADVTITWNWTDGIWGSGIDPNNCELTAMLAGEGSFARVGQCADLDGNQGVQGSGSVRIDKTAPAAAPTFVPAASAAGWYNADVTITWNWTDKAGGSGIDSGNCELTSTLSGEGSFARVGQCADIADNEGVQGTGSIRIDKTVPTAAPTFAPAANAAGWHNTDVTVTFNWTDAAGGSGVDTTRCSTTAAISGEGTNVGYGGACLDFANNTGQTAGALLVDKTAPNTTINSNPSANSTTGDVAFTFSGSDGLSGVAGFECDFESALGGFGGPCTSPQNYTGLANGDYTFSVVAIDVAGNRDQTPVSFSFTVALNDAPVAVDDAYSAVAGSELSIPAPGVLGNDTDAENDALTVAIVSTTSQGTLNLNEDGSFTYNAPATFSGADSFTYQANDGTTNSNTATVTISDQQVVCGGSSDLAANTWRMVALPCAPANPTMNNVWADDLSGTYGTDWRVFAYDATLGRYRQHGLTDAVTQGAGYWVRHTSDQTWSVLGTATPVVSQTDNPLCPSTAGCFEIDLVEPTTAADLFNLVGNPFPQAVNWADVRLQVSESGASDVVYTPSEANAAAINIMSNTRWTFNGANYIACNDTGSPLQCDDMTATPAVGLYEGFWIKLLPGAFGKALKLLIPLTP